MIYRVSKKAPNNVGIVLFDVFLLENVPNSDLKRVECDLTYNEAQDYCAAKMKRDDVFQLELYGDITYVYSQPEFAQMSARNRRDRIEQLTHS